MPMTASAYASKMELNLSSREESPNPAIKAERDVIGKSALPGVAASHGKMVSACVLAYCLPGLGHFVLGRWQRGLLFFITILTMFILGLAMHGHLTYPNVADGFLFDLIPISIFPCFANVGIGLPYFTCLLLHAAQHLDLGFGPPQAVAATYEYGNTFLWTAGLLNYLVILDAYDIAVGRKL
jgi:hypothetical protein